MGKEHEKKIKEQFGKQAAGFSNKALTLNQEDLLDWILDGLHLEKGMSVLDVAGGTGILSRAIASFVNQVTSIDISPEMMNEGRKQTDQKEIFNIEFQVADAENLSFQQESFDVVVSRLAFHHSTNPNQILKEMNRVCVRNGTIGVVDMISPEDDDWYHRYNHYERLRDSSHTNALKRSEFVKLFKTAGLEIKQDEVVDVPVHLESWLTLTKTGGQIKEKIIRDIHKEMETGDVITGLSPYQKNGELMFKQKWMKLTGKRMVEMR